MTLVFRLLLMRRGNRTAQGSASGFAYGLVEHLRLNPVQLC